MESSFSRRYASLSSMKVSNKPPPRRNVHIVVSPEDPRMATVMHEDKVIFTIKTDVSGMHPAITVVATETHLKFMPKGKTGMALWNGTGVVKPDA